MALAKKKNRARLASSPCSSEATQALPELTVPLLTLLSLVSEPLCSHCPKPYGKPGAIQGGMCRWYPAAMAGVPRTDYGHSSHLHTQNPLSQPSRDTLVRERVVLQQRLGANDEDMP